MTNITKCPLCDACLEERTHTHWTRVAVSISTHNRGTYYTAGGLQKSFTSVVTCDAGHTLPMMREELRKREEEVEAAERARKKEEAEAEDNILKHLDDHDWTWDEKMSSKYLGFWTKTYVQKNAVIEVRATIPVAPRSPDERCAVTINSSTVIVSTHMSISDIDNPMDIPSKADSLVGAWAALRENIAAEGEPS